jgi:hypothetical protein
VNVPHDLASLVVGKKGAYIQKLQADHNIEAQLCHKVIDGKQTLLVQGAAAGVLNALAQVEVMLEKLKK